MRKPVVRAAILVGAVVVVAWQLRTAGALDLQLWRFAVQSGDGLCLALVALMMPLNWGLEVVKWGQTAKRPFPLALRDVLAGAAAGFVSPNRIGDGLARVARMPAADRERGIRASLSGSAAQGLMTLLGGAFALRATSAGPALLLAAGLALLVYFSWTPDARGLRRALPSRFGAWLDARLGMSDPNTAALSVRSRAATLLWSALRYLAFTAQYLIALSAFEVDAGWAEVAKVWLVNAAVPTGALAEFGVREASALAVMQPGGLTAPGVVMGTLWVWGVNLLIPGLLGLRQIPKP